MSQDSGDFTALSHAGTDDEVDDQLLIEDHSTATLEVDGSLLMEIEGPSTNLETLEAKGQPSETDPLSNDAFLTAGCGCTRALFSKEHYRKIRLNCQGLSLKELNMVLLGQIMAEIGDTSQVLWLRADIVTSTG